MSIIALRNDFTGWKMPNGDGKVTSAKISSYNTLEQDWGFNDFEGP